MASYSLLFSVKLVHNYFSDNRLSSFYISPDPTTEKLMSNLDLLLQQTADGFAIYYNSELLNLQKDELAFLGKRLNLLLHISDQDFFNYTFLPPSANSLLCFTNAGHQQSTSKISNFPPLSTNSLVSQADLYQCKGSTIYIPALPADQSHIKLTDLFGNTIPPFQITANGMQYAQLNGMYYLYQQTAKTAIYCNPLVCTKNIQAVFELYLANPLIKAPFNICGTKDHATQTFLINFDARSVFWRYNIVNKNNIIVNILSIATNNNKIKFVRQGNVNTANFPTYVFVSESAIKTQQYGMEEFNLVISEDGDNGKKVIESCSIPSISTLKTEENRDYISTYVYI